MTLEHELHPTLWLDVPEEPGDTAQVVLQRILRHGSDAAQIA